MSPWQEKDGAMLTALDRHEAGRTSAPEETAPGRLRVARFLFPDFPGLLWVSGTPVLSLCCLLLGISESFLLT